MFFQVDFVNNIGLEDVEAQKEQLGNSIDFVDSVGSVGSSVIEHSTCSVDYLAHFEHSAEQ